MQVLSCKYFCISFNIKNYNYIDHTYAITTHKSQGASYNNDIYCAKADNVDQKQFYVAASRSRHDFEIFVDDKERFFENVKTEQQKASTLDYIQDNKREQKLESEIHQLNSQGTSLFPMGKRIGSIGSNRLF